MKTPEWKQIPRTEHVAALSVMGPYVVSHRPEIHHHVACFRPPGRHHHIGSFPTAEEALHAAEAHKITHPEPSAPKGPTSKPSSYPSAQPSAAPEETDPKITEP